MIHNPKSWGATTTSGCLHPGHTSRQRLQRSHQLAESPRRTCPWQYIGLAKASARLRGVRTTPKERRRETIECSRNENPLAQESLNKPETELLENWQLKRRCRDIMFGA